MGLEVPDTSELWQQRRPEEAILLSRLEHSTTDQVEPISSGGHGYDGN